MAFRKYEMGMELLLINKMGTGLNKAAAQVHRFGAQVDAISAKSAFAASSLMSLHGGFMVAAAGGLLANFAITSVQQFSMIETKWAEVTTLMPGQLKAVTDMMLDDVRDFSVEFGRELGGTINASYEAISAGIEDHELLDFLEDADKAARAGITELDVAVDALTTTLNVYNLEVEDTDDVSDAFFATIQIGKTRFAELATSVGTFLPLMENLNVEYEEALLLQGALTAQGRTAAEAATQLASLGTAFLKKGVTSDFLKELGINVQEFLDDGNTMIELLHIMKVALERDGKTFTEIMGRKEAALASLAVTNEKFVEDFVRGMLNMEGATTEAFGKIEDTITIEIGKMKAEWAEFQLEFSQLTVPVVSALLEMRHGVNDLRRSFDEFMLSVNPLYEGWLRLTDGLYEGYGVWTDTKTAMNDNYQVMNSVLGISEGLSEQTGIMSLTYENVTENAAHFVDELERQAEIAAVAASVNFTLAHSILEVSKQMQQQYQMSALHNRIMGEQEALAAEYQMYQDTGTYMYLEGVKTAFVVPTAEDIKGGAGKKEKEFDLDAVKYEFGEISHDEYLAILQKRLNETGGKLTREGAPIWRTMEQVKANKARETTEEVTRESRYYRDMYSQQDAEYQAGLMTETQYINLLQERLNRHSKYSPMGMQASNILKRMLDKNLSDSKLTEDLLWQTGMMSDKDYEGILKRRVEEAGGLGTIEGLQAQKKLLDWLERQAKEEEKLSKAIEDLVETIKEPQVIEVEAFTEEGVVLRGDTVRQVERRAVNRRGRPVVRI